MVMVDLDLTYGDTNTVELYIFLFKASIFGVYFVLSIYH